MLKSSKAKSGIAARQFAEEIALPPNSYIVGAASYSTSVREGRGYASVRCGVNNDTAGRLRVLQAWEASGPWIIVRGTTTSLDPSTGLHAADLVVPITRKYVVVTFVGVLGANFQLGADFYPR